ncbi:hypothetical protein CHLRE_16g675861v5 [Chlamydomonas reinhardtii]|uniref:Small ubiquitin-related modifier n=1 Tax=Chlamydomonas reinhardtii TaxID=3055 RepID=A0A2K3CVT7_CHLRE|nr:uncharacterized protein CHLRE_16g675861v5 [Chlamydomonas reinhardtii]PNW72397.1 hypothetical protein CHLRE_16g675861v5 [Chlamydomonas reinhardtii]
MSEGGADNQAEIKTEGGIINLVVKDQEGSEVHFKVKMKTKLEKVIDAYCKKKALDASTIRFLYDGNRVNPTNTPAELGMEDGDTIDCLITQLGGGSSYSQRR